MSDSRKTEDNANGTERSNGAQQPGQDALDSFSRRFGPDSQNNTPSGSGSRAIAHRPSPLVLSPPPPRHPSNEPHYRGHEDHDDTPRGGGGRARNSLSGSPEATASQTTRKRSAPDELEIHLEFSDGEAEEFDDENIPDSVFDEPPLQTPATTTNQRGEDFNCLCRREPKIPRPRNVFMLFRQNYQAQVVAENPGVANPQVSKIIGRMWKKLDAQTKAHWKQLAEDEKIRHRERYPNYRYQPKRAKKGKGKDRPGSADGGDSNRCPECHGRLSPVPSSARSIPNSARPQHPPPSPYGPSRGDMRPSSAGGGYDINGARSHAPFPSPGLRAHQSPPRGPGSSSRDAEGRRPLPPHGRPGYPGQGHRDHPYSHEDELYTPFDQRRYHYEVPTPYSARFPPYGHGDGSPHPSHALPSRHRPHNGPPQQPQVPHSASHNHFPHPGSSHPPTSPWMRPPPPPPMRQPPRAYTGQPPPRHGYDTMGEPQTPASGHPSRGEAYGGVSGRLPPPTPRGGHGYHHTPGYGAPSTPMASLSLRQGQTPTTATPGLNRPMDTNRSAASNRERLLYQKHERPTSGFTEEPFKLPPIMTQMSSGPQSGRRFSDSGEAAGHGRPGGESSTAAVDVQRNGVQAGRPTATPPHLRDMHTFASSPTPITTKHDDDWSLADKDSQASGVRAMVMSVSHLNKLVVLRRISPPKSLLPRRGPVIAIEGRNDFLRGVVGRAVERALNSIGGCNARSWTMAPSDGKKPDSGDSGAIQKQSADSGLGSSVQGEDVSMAPSPESGGDCNSRRGSASNGNETTSLTSTSLSFTVKDIDDLMSLSMTWRRVWREIDAHIHDFGSYSSISGSTSVSRKGKERATGPPSPARSPMALSPGSLSPKTKPAELDEAPGPEDSHSPSATTATDAQQEQPVPVALIKTGYSLAISDKCAMSIPIEDGYAPVDHWQYMASMWRGIPGPDLVIYADAAPAWPTAKKSDLDQTVGYTNQESVLIVNIPPESAVDVRARTDDVVDGLLCRSTERRLEFEIQELIRAHKTGKE